MLKEIEIDLSTLGSGCPRLEIVLRLLKAGAPIKYKHLLVFLEDEVEFTGELETWDDIERPNIKHYRWGL